MTEEIKKEKEVWEELKLNVAVKILTTDDNDELIEKQDLGNIDFKYSTKNGNDIMDAIKKCKKSVRLLTKNWLDKQIVKTNKYYGSLCTIVKAGSVLITGNDADWIDELEEVYVSCESFEKNKDYILLDLMHHVSDELIIESKIKFYIREA